MKLSGTSATEEPEPIVRFTVDMPLSLHQALSLAAVKTRRKKAAMVRFAIWQLLKDLDDEAMVK